MLSPVFSRCTVGVNTPFADGEFHLDLQQRPESSLLGVAGVLEAHTTDACVAVRAWAGVQRANFSLLRTPSPLRTWGADHAARVLR